jgi:hypothetical protein
VSPALPLVGATVIASSVTLPTLDSVMVYVVLLPPPPPPPVGLGQPVNARIKAKTVKSEKFLLLCITEDGRRKTEDGRRKTEDGRRKTEDGRRFLSLS